MIAVGVACVDDETERAAVPVQRVIEIGGGHIQVVLPRTQHKAEVAVATAPVVAVDIATITHAVEIVEIDFVDGLVLFGTEVQLISHLVGQEQGFPLCLGVRHSLGGDGHDHQHCQGYQLFHNLDV